MVCHVSLHIMVSSATMSEVRSLSPKRLTHGNGNGGSSGIVAPVGYKPQPDFFNNADILWIVRCFFGSECVREEDLALAAGGGRARRTKIGRCIWFSWILVVGNIVSRVCFSWSGLSVRNSNALFSPGTAVLHSGERRCHVVGPS